MHDDTFDSSTDDIFETLSALSEASEDETDDELDIFDQEELALAEQFAAQMRIGVPPAETEQDEPLGITVVEWDEMWQHDVYQDQQEGDGNAMWRRNSASPDQQVGSHFALRIFTAYMQYIGAYSQY